MFELMVAGRLGNTYVFLFEYISRNLYILPVCILYYIDHYLSLSTLSMHDSSDSNYQNSQPLNPNIPFSPEGKNHAHACILSNTIIIYPITSTCNHSYHRPSPPNKKKTLTMYTDFKGHDIRIYRSCVRLYMRILLLLTVKCAELTSPGVIHKSMRGDSKHSSDLKNAYSFRNRRCRSRL